MRLLKTQKLTQDEESPLDSSVLPLVGLPPHSPPGACAPTGAKFFTFHLRQSPAKRPPWQGRLIESTGLGARAVSLEAWLWHSWPRAVTGFLWPSLSLVEQRGLRGPSPGLLGRLKRDVETTQLQLVPVCGHLIKCSFAAILMTIC